MVCMLSGGMANARDYHVSARGDDAHPGSAAKPWRSLARVNRAGLRPGDRVLLEGGQTFAGPLVLEAHHRGAKGKRVEVSSYGEGRAAIDGGKGDGVTANGCSHVRLSNLKIVGCGRKEGSDGRGVALRDGTDLEVDQVDISGFRVDGLVATSVREARITHVYAHDNGSAGIAVGGGDTREAWSRDVYIGYCVAENNPGDPLNLDNHSGNGIVVGGVAGCLIEYCEALNNGWDMPRKGNGPVGIWAWNADRVTIQFCVAHDNHSPGHDGGGFDLDGGLTNCVLQYNYSYRNDGPGCLLCQYPGASEWKHNLVRYNISINDCAKNNRQCAFDIYGGDYGMSDAEVYHNTVYNEVGGAVSFGGLPAPRIRFRNNLLVGTGRLIRGDASPSRFEGNCYWSLDPGADFADGGKTFADWVKQTGQEQVKGVTVGCYADPQLVDPRVVELTDPGKLATLLGYQLKQDSPCRGVGVPVEDDGGRDFWGIAVPRQRKPDLGASQSP